MPIWGEIRIPEDVPTYEAEYHLPRLRGTPRQVSWGRIIRHQFLSELLPQIIDAIASLSPEESAAVINTLPSIRNEATAKTWIEKFRPELGDATSLVVNLARQKAAQELQADAEASVLLS